MKMIRQAQGRSYLRITFNNYLSRWRVTRYTMPFTICEYYSTWVFAKRGYRR